MRILLQLALCLVAFSGCDRGVPASPVELPHFALGSWSNPVRCSMPSGERQYLERLRCPDGSQPSYRRIGSYGKGPDGHVLDGYRVELGSRAFVVYMDMYHRDHVERNAPPGFTLVVLADEVNVWQRSARFAN